MNIKILFLLSLVFTNVAHPQKKEHKEHKWVHFYITSSGYEWQYDKLTVKKRGGHSLVWVKKMPTTDSISAKIMAEYEEHGKDIKWLDYQYTLNRCEINCNEDKLRIISNIKYGNNNNVLESWDGDDETFKNIAPDTMGEALEKKVCE